MFIKRDGSNDGNKFAYYGELFLFRLNGNFKLYLSGSGNKDYLYSASHGAGRALSRGKAIKISDKKIDEFLSQYVVITPVDTENVNVKNRPDIIKKWKDELKSEAPYAYKDIEEIINVHEKKNIANSIAELKPILSIKG